MLVDLLYYIRLDTRRLSYIHKHVCLEYPCQRICKLTLRVDSPSSKFFCIFSRMISALTNFFILNAFF
ncbi:hypothetical protein Plhal304r1_c029g0096801 [Plasmopara halstedii]